MSINGEDDDDGVNQASGDTGNFGVDQLRRIGRTYGRLTSQERAMRDRARRAQSDLVNADFISEHAANIPLEKGMSEDHWSKFAVKLRTSAEKTLGSVQSRLRIANEAKRERVNQQAINTISSAYSESSISGMVSRAMNTTEVQQRGTGLSGYSWEGLLGEKEKIMGQISQKRTENVMLAGHYVGGHGINTKIERKFTDDAQSMTGLIAQLGPINAAMKQQRTLGLDPESKQQELIRVGAKASDIVSFNRLQEDLQKGKSPYSGLSADDFRKRETEAAQKLVTALDELRNSAGKTKEELGKLNKNAEEAANEFKEIEDARRAGGGRGGGDGYRSIQAYSSAVAQLANVAVSAVQTIGINQPMQQMGNISGYANLENQKYDMYRSALGGDMSARLNMSGWGSAGAFGGRMATNTGFRLGFQAIGGIAATAGGIAQTAEASIQSVNPIAAAAGKADRVSSIAQGLTGAAEGVSMTATTALDAMRHISTSQAEIAGINASMGATKQINYVQGHQLQQYRDYMVGMTGAARGMGLDRGSAFLGQTGGDAFMNQMQTYGLGIDQASSLAQAGVQNMGSMFNSSQIVQAKRFENLGLGSAEENMRRMTALGAGGQNPSQSLEKILELAVGRGLDSSKTQTMIAENIGQLVEKTAMGGGPDITGELSRLVIGTIDKNNPNQELATKQALATYSSQEEIRNNRSVSFAGQIAVSRMQTELGLDWDSGFGIQAMSAAKLKEISKMTGTDATNELRLHGVDVSDNKFFKENKEAFFNKAVRSKLMTEVEAGGTGWGFGANNNFQKVLGWMEEDSTGARAQAWASGKADGLPQDVAAQQESFIKALRANNPNQDPRVVMRGMAALFAPQAGNKSLGTGVLGEDTSELGQMIQERDRGNQQQIGAAQAGGNILGGTSGKGRITGLNASGAALEQASPGEMAWQKAAAESAASFGASARTLDSASGKLVDAATKLMSVAGIMELSKTDANDKKELKFPDQKSDKDKQPISNMGIGQNY